MVVDSPPPAAPSANRPGLTFWIDEVDAYENDPTCGYTSELTVNRITDDMEWSFRHHNLTGSSRHSSDPSSARIRPSHWLEHSFNPVGNDANGADSAELAVFAGHGALPESPNWGYLDATPPLMAALMPREEFPSYGETLCLAPLANGSTTQFPHKGGLGLPSVLPYVGPVGGRTSHAIFLASCMGAFRLRQPYSETNRTSQTFGFRGSPVLGPRAKQNLGRLYEASKTNNLAAWESTMGPALQLDGAPSGPVVTAVSTVSYADAFEVNTFASLWQGVHALRRLPPSSQILYFDSVSRDACGRDPMGRPATVIGAPCHEPASSCPAISGSDVKPLQGDPQRTTPASTPVAGANLPTFRIKRTPRSPPEISFAAQSLATAMTNENYFSASRDFDTAVIKNLSGDVNYSQLPGGMLVRYDPQNDRLTLFDSQPHQGLAIDPTQATSIIETWLSNLSSAGLRSMHYWTIDKPLVSEFVRSGADSLGNAYQPELKRFEYSVYRKVNGLPWRETYLTLWLDAAGQVDFLEITGLDGSLSGPPGSESDPELPGIITAFDKAGALLVANNWFHKKYGTEAKPHWQWFGLVYEQESNWSAVVRPYVGGLVAPEVGGVAPRMVRVRFRAEDLDAPVEVFDD